MFADSTSLSATRGIVNNVVEPILYEIFPHSVPFFILPKRQWGMVTSV